MSEDNMPKIPEEILLFLRDLAFNKEYRWAGCIFSLLITFTSAYFWFKLYVMNNIVLGFALIGVSLLAWYFSIAVCDGTVCLWGGAKKIWWLTRQCITQKRKKRELEHQQRQAEQAREEKKRQAKEEFQTQMQKMLSCLLSMPHKEASLLRYIFHRQQNSFLET